MKFYDDVKQFRKRITTPDKVVLYLTQKIPIFSFFDSLTAFYLFIGKNEIQHPSHTLYHCKKRVPMFFFSGICVYKSSSKHILKHIDKTHFS